LRYSFNR
jgi:alpha-glucan, water dikinase